MQEAECQKHTGASYNSVATPWDPLASVKGACKWFVLVLLSDVDKAEAPAWAMRNFRQLPAERGSEFLRSTTALPTSTSNFETAQKLRSIIASQKPRKTLIPRQQ